MTLDHDDPLWQAAWEAFKKARPQWANHHFFDFGSEELELAFLEWHAEIEAALDRGVPGFPQDTARGLREIGDELKKLRAGREAIASFAARFDEWGPLFHAEFLRHLKSLPEPERAKQIAEFEAAWKELTTVGPGVREDIVRRWNDGLERERAEAKQSRNFR